MEKFGNSGDSGNSNPNDPPRGGKPSKYDHIERVLKEITPDEEKFKNRVYPASEVECDMKLLAAFENSPNYRKLDERADSVLLEKTFMDMAEKDDWFREDELYAEEPEFVALTTTPTAKIDDCFNHIDMVSLIKNRVTGDEVMPFAVDLTYNTNSEKMRQKFSWKHVFGVKGPLEAGASEFGTITSENETSPLPLKQRRGLKIPGFASAKYFEDSNSLSGKEIQPGRIKVMPRFVVGYSPEVADVLAAGAPTEEVLAKYGKMVFNRQAKEFNRAKTYAKWCTLLECSEQAKSIQKMLDNLTENDTKYMDAEELETARKQIAAVQDYFSKAVKTNYEHACAEQKKENERKKEKGSMITGEMTELQIRSAVRRDPVLNEISNQNNLIFNLGGWKTPEQGKHDVMLERSLGKVARMAKEVS